MEEVNPDREEEAPEINNIPGELKCICGKTCKGLRGLRSHQRSCRPIKHMGDEISMNDAVHDLSGNVAKRSVSLEETPKVKSGIKLPNNSEEWKIANTYFQSSLSTIDITRVGRISHALDESNRVMYDYFNENYGLINNKDQQEINRLKMVYKDFTKKDLKKELKKLKSQQTHDATRIKYVVKLLRGKVENKDTDIKSTSPLQDDLTMQRNYWGSCKRLFVNKRNATIVFKDHLRKLLSKSSLTRKPIQSI